MLNTLKRTLPLFLCIFLVAQENLEKADNVDTQIQNTNQEEQSEGVWGRKFQASFGFSYLTNGNYGLNIGYGVWDVNKIGILADLFVPVNSNNYGDRLYAVTFFLVREWKMVKWLSLLQKTGYGARILENKNQYQLSWFPSIGLDLSFNINNMFRFVVAYSWSMYENFEEQNLMINNIGLSLRISY